MWPRQDHTSPSPKIHAFTATFFSGTKRMSIIPSIPIYVTYLKPLAPHILHSVNLYTDLYLNFSDPIFHPSPHLKLFHFWVPLELVIGKISFLNVFFMHSFSYFLWDPSLPLGPCFSCSPPEQWLFLFQSLRITGPESGVGFLFLHFIDAVRHFPFFFSSKTLSLTLAPSNFGTFCPFLLYFPTHSLLFLVLEHFSSWITSNTPPAIILRDFKILTDDPSDARPLSSLVTAPPLNLSPTL